VLVRKDLSPSQICVQSAHACIESTKHSPYEGEHPSVIVCGIDNETKLNNSAEKLEALGITCFKFREPDIGNQLTAIATVPIVGETRSHFRKFQLLKL